MAKGNRIWHLLSGGFFTLNRLQDTHAQKKRKQKYRRSNLSQWMGQANNPDALTFHAAGVSVRQLLRIANFGDEMMGFAKDVVDPVIGLCDHRGYTKSWPHTEAAKAGFVSHLDIAGASNPVEVYSPRNLTVSNGDICQSGSWVIFNTSLNKTLLAGRVIEIIQVVESLEARLGKCSFVVVAPSISSEPDDHYWMPHLELLPPTSWLTLEASDIKCTVNVQHNCAKHSCTLGTEIAIIEERENTGQSYMGVLHKVPEDLILNTAQMRDAVHITPFHPRMPQFNREEVITRAALLEINDRKKRQAKQADLAAAKNAGAAATKKTKPKPTTRLQKVSTQVRSLMSARC
ncbi:hypothetical protein DXG01_002988 [Tephrocybe rancida]|nr:hypothetical protein DXG01_002988 [Tephrocybe rancida]